MTPGEAGDNNGGHSNVFLDMDLVALLAQLVEHLICNQKVVGSIPTGSFFFNLHSHYT
jgi:hypothetical protein